MGKKRSEKQETSIRGPESTDSERIQREREKKRKRGEKKRNEKQETSIRGPESFDSGRPNRRFGASSGRIEKRRKEKKGQEKMKSKRL